MKFLVPNYSCLQNPWLGGLPPPDPRSHRPLSSTEFLEPPPEQNSWVRHWIGCLETSRNVTEERGCRLRRAEAWRHRSVQLRTGCDVMTWDRWLTVGCRRADTPLCCLVQRQSTQLGVCCLVPRVYTIKKPSSGLDTCYKTWKGYTIAFTWKIYKIGSQCYEQAIMCPCYAAWWMFSLMTTSWRSKHVALNDAHSHTSARHSTLCKQLTWGFVGGRKTASPHDQELEGET